MDKPSFLKDSPKAAAPKEPFPNPSQKSGTSNTPDGELDNFPNRKQSTGTPEGNPNSKVPGGKTPFSPYKAPKLPAKLGK